MERRKSYTGEKSRAEVRCERVVDLLAASGVKRCRLFLSRKKIGREKTKAGRGRRSEE